jgi:zinc transport system permease protein
MSYLTRALLAAALVGAMAPVVGAFLVQRRLSMIGDGLGHVAFAGAAFAALIGAAALPWGLLIACTGAGVIELLQRKARARPDIAISVIFYLGIAAGVVMLSAAQRYDAGALAVLFGSLLTVSEADLVVIGAVCVIALAVSIAFYRQFFLLVLGEETALVAGVRAGLAAALLSVTTAAAVVAGMRAVGVLLVASLIVMPAAASQRLVRGFKASLATASAIGVGCGAVGLWIAVQADWPPGATIALTAIGVYLASVAISSLRPRGHRRRRVN